MDFVIEGFSYHPTIQRLHPTVKGLEEYRVRLPNRPRRKKRQTSPLPNRDKFFKFSTRFKNLGVRFGLQNFFKKTIKSLSRESGDPTFLVQLNI